MTEQELTDDRNLGSALKLGSLTHQTLRLVLDSDSRSAQELTIPGTFLILPVVSSSISPNASSEITYHHLPGSHLFLGQFCSPLDMPPHLVSHPYRYPDLYPSGLVGGVFPVYQNQDGLDDTRLATPSIDSGRQERASMSEQYRVVRR
jgi:hypothetical protein